MSVLPQQRVIGKEGMRLKGNMCKGKEVPDLFYLPADIQWCGWSVTICGSYAAGKTHTLNLSTAEK
jgi:hypothetical protein